MMRSMAALLSVLFLCSALAGTSQEPEKAPALPVQNEVPGLKLPGNITTTPGKLVRIAAESPGKVMFELIPSGEFEVEAEIELDAKRVLLVAPPASQAILVLAVGVVDGEPTKFARCYVVSAGSPNDGAIQASKPEPLKPLPSGRLHVTVVADGVPWLESPTLKKALADAGHTLHPLKPNAPEVAARQLERFVTKAGGPPALIVQDASGKVLLTRRLPGSEGDLLKLILSGQ